MSLPAKGYSFAADGNSTHCARKGGANGRSLRAVWAAKRWAPH